MNLHVAFAQSNCCQSLRALEYKAECVLSVPRTEQESWGAEGCMSEFRGVGSLQGTSGDAAGLASGVCPLLPLDMPQFPSHKIGVGVGRQANKGDRLLLWGLPNGKGCGGVMSLMHSHIK